MTITIEDFQKIELKVGKIIAVEPLGGSDKLLRLNVDLGEGTPRQILAGIKKAYLPEELVEKQVVVANLEPKTILGEESQGMILCADSEQGPVLLRPEKEVPPGTKIK